MYGKKIRVIITVASLVVIAALLTVLAVAFLPKNEYETSDIKDYGDRAQTRRDLNLSFFPEAIPQNADATYHYYCLDSVHDEYLELRFDSADELSEFVEAILTGIEKDKLISRQNPYNDSYTEYFCTSVSAGSFGDKLPQNFNFIETYNDSHLGAFFYSMNISSDDLTVIISYLNGKFDAENYLPIYLERFDIVAEGEFIDRVSFDVYKIKTGR